MLNQKSNFSHLVFAVLLLSFTFVQSTAQNTKPVLVIFHDLEETSEDLADAGNSALQTGQFAEVVLTDYDWKMETVADAAARIFRELTKKLDKEQFVLYGFGKGGLVAEWIATRVKEADARIARVITVDAPFDGLQKPGLEINSPGLQDVTPNSPTLQALRSAPLNNTIAIEFIRLWEKGNAVVVQNSALRKPTGGENQTSQLIVRTKPFDPREVIPEMLDQAEKDYETKQYNKVIDACRYILKTEPQNAQANGLLGLSFYSSAIVESNANRAAELFNESLQYFTNAIVAGHYFTFPVAHHHNFGSSFGVLVVNDACYGSLIIDKDTVAFQGQSDHRFLAPISKVSAQFVASEVGTLHVEVGFDKKNGQEKRKVYNFLPSQIRMSTSFAQLTPTATIGNNQASCDERCPLIPQSLNRLINKVQQLPTQAVNPKGDIQMDAVHFAFREKNKHVGRLTFSENGLRWEELSNNPDSKHNFSISWSSLEKVFLSHGLWFTLIYKENKKSRTFELAADVAKSIELAKMIYRYCGIAPES